MAPVDPPKPAAPLKRWHRRYARWLASHLGQRLTRAQQIDKATELAGKPVAWHSLGRLNRHPVFREYLEQQQDKVSEEVTQRTKLRYIKLLSKGADLHVLAINHLAKEIASGDDKMSAVRAVAPLVSPLLDRGWPKKQEQEVNTNIKITLTTHQQARLDAPVMDVSAEEVPYEVISEEPAA